MSMRLDADDGYLEVFYNEIDVFIYIGFHTYPGNFHRLLNLFDVKEDLV